jgi:hypothetical protein
MSTEDNRAIPESFWYRVSWIDASGKSLTSDEMAEKVSSYTADDNNFLRECGIVVDGSN